MPRKLVESKENVTLLGGAPVPPGVLEAALGLAPVLVAADGAARLALEMGQMPHAVIGDFDSLDLETRGRIPDERLHEIHEQDSTDFDKALRSIAAPLVLAVGFTGARLDHELAVYNTLVRRDERCVVVGENDLCFHVPAVLRMDLTVGTRLSLFPLARVSGTSLGLRWPIDGLHFAPDGRVGTSNETIDASVTVTMDGPGMLAILPREYLSETARALAPG